MDVYSSGEWHVKAGREEEFVRAWHELASASSEAYTSNTWSVLLRDKQDPRHFRSLAGWGDAQQAADWRTGDTYARKTEKLVEMVEKLDISLFEPVVTLGSMQQPETAGMRY